MSLSFPIPDWGDNEGFHYPGVSIDKEIVVKKSKNKKRKLNGDGTFEKCEPEDLEVPQQASKKKKRGKIDPVPEIKKIESTKELTRNGPKKIKKEEKKTKTKKTFSNQEENQSHASELQTETGNKLLLRKKKKNRKNNKYKELNKRQKEERMATQTGMAEGKSESKQQNITTIKKSQESFRAIASKEEVQSSQNKEVKKKKKKKKKSKLLDNTNSTVHEEDSTISLKNSPDTSHHDVKQNMKHANGHESEVNSHNSQAIDVDIKKKKKSASKSSDVIVLNGIGEQSYHESNSHQNASNGKVKKKNKIRSGKTDVEIIEKKNGIESSASIHELEKVVAGEGTKKKKKKKEKGNSLKAKDNISDSKKVKLDKQKNGRKFSKKVKESDDEEELIFDGDEECSESFKKDFRALLSSLNFSQVKTPDSGRGESNDDDDDEFEMSNGQEFAPTKKHKRSLDKDNEDERKNKGLKKKKKMESAKTTQMKVNDRQDSNECQTPRSAVKKNAKFNKEKVAKLLEEAARIQREKPSPPSGPVDSLKQKMEERLMAARFRMVNEELYTKNSSEAQQLFKRDPAAFDAYHQGYQTQVRQWPVNPLDLIVKWLSKKPKEWVVADMGCGEATLAQRVPQSCVHSLDLVAANPQVTACDMAHTPLAAASVDVVVFCLSLMGTNLKDFMMEANRVLRSGGIMKIAEVESRFGDVKEFEKHLARYGFHCTARDTSHQYFFLFDFKKTHKLKKMASLPDIFLKPCLYKKR
ncbi:protein IWS1 homolog isoform X1 [Scylla paramamosain]|uniref:protein IWS1 homolog isoform X1 n=2 Tax=Scylla paramamosain TaxID=85552 RepID=UPI0030835B5A